MSANETHKAGTRTACSNKARLYKLAKIYKGGMRVNSKTMGYILKRALLAIVTVWVVITVTFFVMRAVPGGPFIGEKAITAETQAALEAKYGLDKPLMEQYFTYLKDIVTKFDFGPSLKQRGRDVIDVITDGMGISIKLGVIAAFSALVIGIVMGSIAALRRNKFIDKVLLLNVQAIFFVEVRAIVLNNLIKEILILFSITK